LKETNFRETDPEMIKRLADEAYGDGAPVKGRRLDILLGNCGAGKSRVTDALAKEIGAMTPDSDHIKAKIPGYDKGMGNQAVHEDSSAAYKILLDRALKNGDNIVWQGVGKTAQSVIDLITQAKANGYEVHVHMIDAPPEVAAKRVYTRANGEPDANGIRQMIPPEVPLNPKYQYVPRLNFFKMIGDAALDFQANGQKQIDGFRLWRSTGAINEKLPPGTFIPSVRPLFTPVDRANNNDDEQINPEAGLFNVNKPEDNK
jgi:predicted kinase